MSVLGSYRLHRPFIHEMVQVYPVYHMILPLQKTYKPDG